MYGDDIFKVKIISSKILPLKLLHASPKQPTEMFYAFLMQVKIFVHYIIWLFLHHYVSNYLFCHVKKIPHWQLFQFRSDSEKNIWEIEIFIYAGVLSYKIYFVWYKLLSLTYISNIKRYWFQVLWTVCAYTKLYKSKYLMTPIQNNNHV